MEPLAPWLFIGAASAFLALCLMLGLRLISAKRFAQIVAGPMAGLAIGFAVSRLSLGGVHG